MKYLLIIFLSFIGIKISAQTISTLTCYDFPFKEKTINLQVTYLHTPEQSQDTDVLVKELLFLMLECDDIAQTSQEFIIELKNRTKINILNITPFSYKKKK